MSFTRFLKVLNRYKAIFIAFALIFNQSDSQGQSQVESYAKLKEALKNPNDVTRLRLTNISMLPGEIGDLRNLTSFECENCSFANFPLEFWNLSKLTSITMWRNNNIKSLPPQIANLQELTYLDLDQCHSLKNLPSEMASLKKLERLVLSGADIDAIPEWFGDLESLEELLIDENNIKSLPSSIGKLSKLQILALDDNPLNSFPSSVASLSNLTCLSFSESVQDFPMQIESCQSLLYLGLTSYEDFSINNYKLSVEEEGSLQWNLNDCWVMEIGCREIKFKQFSTTPVYDFSGNQIHTISCCYNGKFTIRD